MTKVLSGQIDPFDDDYEPPMSARLKSVDKSSSFLELDVYRERGLETGLLSAALWHDLGMAEGWTTSEIVRRGANTFVSGAFEMLFVTETTVRFYALWQRGSEGLEECVTAEAVVISPRSPLRPLGRFGLAQTP